ncbi:ganglioside GM2 activator-like [Coccinella septempunctata]|uniref:ganglioside GM2 activator-like n=1 Tax=Coccinella septempunctata TaxID=41139 RepID=UPI001D08763B|nr:ganglioside GM2 activator-like [Coccinella septempunctata]
MIESFHTKIFNFGQKVMTEIVYEVRQEIGDLKMTAQISRCNYTKNSTCEVYLEKATISDICDIIEMENTAWTIYLQTFDPPITKCPVQRGNYTSRYASEKTEMIDLSAWFSDGLWRIQNNLYSGDRRVGCFITEIEIFTPEHNV